MYLRAEGDRLIADHPRGRLGPWLTKTLTDNKPALLAQAFGTFRYGTLAGLMAMVVTLATTAGAFIAGLARTAYGSYVPVVVAVGALCVVSAACLLRAERLPLADPAEPR